jgi:transposase-like protein
VQEAIAADIEQGRSMRSAARKQDLTPHTVMNWMQRGEADLEEDKENEYTEFFTRITRAKGYGEEWYLDTIMELAEENEDHRFLMSLMKQRYPDSWGETETGVDADTVKLEVSEDVKQSWPEQ